MANCRSFFFLVVVGVREFFFLGVLVFVLGLVFGAVTLPFFFFGDATPFPLFNALALGADDTFS
jgi:hypothetical protein